jgi:hypothetical protein
MKTFKEIVESLPPHLQGKFSDKVNVSVNDKTPSFTHDKEIVVYTKFRKEAIDSMKKEKIRFNSTGTSSGRFTFSDDKMFLKALDILNKAGIKIADRSKS